MRTRETKIGDRTAIVEESEGSGVRTHFACANGFPFGVYQRFVRELRGELDLFSLALPPLWPDAGDPDPALRWDDHADALIELLEAEGGPVLGLGHSMGATITAFAAARRPDLFRGLIVIEPAMVAPWLEKALEWTPLAMKKQAQPIRGTLHRRDRWDDRAAFVEWAHDRRPFNRLGEEGLGAFACLGLVDDPEGGVTLSFPKRWEAHYYSCPPDGLPVLEQLGDMPTVGIRGAPSRFLTDKLWQEWQRRCSHHAFRELPVESHLMPLEAPELTAREVLEAWASLET